MARDGTRWFKEPLLHFLLIGAAIYVCYGLFVPSQEMPDDRTVTITAGEIASLAANWQRRWNRPPTAQELDGLVRQYARELVLYREALAMGLDDDDVVIRRRMVQKLEFLSQDLMTPPAPETDVLESWFAEHIDDYREPDRYTVTHIYLNADSRGGRTTEEAAAIRDELNALPETPRDLSAYGDRFMLQNYYPDRSAAELTRLLGPGFAESVTQMEPGRWHGPVLSDYGVHVVRVEDHRQAPTPEFRQMEDRVRQDWINARREELNDQFLDAILARYEIIVEEADVPVLGQSAGDDDAGEGGT